MAGIELQKEHMALCWPSLVTILTQVDRAKALSQRDEAGV